MDAALIEAMDAMSRQTPWATAALIAALPLAFVVAPVLAEMAARLRRR